MNAIRAGFSDELGATVRWKSGNLRRSLSAGDVEPKETYIIRLLKIYNLCDKMDSYYICDYSSYTCTIFQYGTTPAKFSVTSE